MPKAARDVAAGLQKKGFLLRESHHSFYHLYVDGKKTVIFTRISQGEKEIHDALLGAMARQVKLNRKQFNDLVECPLTLEEYVRLLQRDGAIETPKARNN